MTSYDENRDYWAAMYWLAELAPEAKAAQFSADVGREAAGVPGAGMDPGFSSVTGRAYRLVLCKRMEAARQVWADHPQRDIPRIKSRGEQAFREWDSFRTEAANKAAQTATRAEMDRQISVLTGLGYQAAAKAVTA